MAECIACHGRNGIADECDTCHAGRSESERLGAGAWRVTHGANWQTAHGMGALETCASCHPRDYCVRCHGVPLPHDDDFDRRHSEYSVADGARCVECHRDTFCSDCHGIEMPHPEGFTAQHATLVADDGDDLCRECHAMSDCSTCHLMHVHPGLSDEFLRSLRGEE